MKEWIFMTERGRERNSFPFQQKNFNPQYEKKKKKKEMLAMRSCGISSLNSRERHIKAKDAKILGAVFLKKYVKHRPLGLIF